MISLILTLVVIGILLWAVNSFIPMDSKIRNILNIVVVVCVIFYLLNAFGVLPISDVKVPRVR